MCLVLREAVAVCITIVVAVAVGFTIVVAVVQGDSIVEYNTKNKNSSDIKRIVVLDTRTVVNIKVQVHQVNIIQDTLVLHTGSKRGITITELIAVVVVG